MKGRIMTTAVICAIVMVAAIGTCRPPAPPCEDAPIAEDERGDAVLIDDLRQVVLHFDDDIWAEYVMHRDDVNRFIRGVVALGDEQINGITVYRMRRNWPSSWTRDELSILFGDGHAPIYGWTLHESTIQLSE